MEPVVLSNNISPILEALTNPEVLRVVLGFFIFLFLIMSAILVFHWHRYGMKSRVIVVAEIVFFIGALFFMLTAAFSIFLF